MKDIVYCDGNSLASIDWTVQESSGTASDYITTTIRFLEDTFRAFTHLPVRLNDCQQENISCVIEQNSSSSSSRLLEKSKFVGRFILHLKISNRSKFPWDIQEILAHALIQSFIHRIDSIFLFPRLNYLKQHVYQLVNISRLY